MNSELPQNGAAQSTQRRNRRVAWYGILVLVLLLGFLVYWALVLRHHEYTNDAYVQGNMVSITSLRPGFITSIHSDDTFWVKKGQLLVDLDTTDSLIELERTQADLATAVREVCQNFHQVFVYKAEIEVSLAELKRAQQDFDHRQQVIHRGGVSKEDMEHATAALDASSATLQRVQSLYQQAQSAIQGISIKSHPKVLAAVNGLREAFVRYKRCKIYSPVEGLVAQRKAQVGMWIEPNKPIMSVIPLDQMWVNANFKETQMKHMRIGQKVDLTSDLYGGNVYYRGVVVGLPGAAGDAFSLLPPQNLSGNWIKIVQRVPVRISIDPTDLQKAPLRIGLSMEATVRLTDTEGPLVPDTAVGPTYETQIYEDELKGAQELITQIIDSNLDPSLIEYASHPFLMAESESPL